MASEYLIMCFDCGEHLCTQRLDGLTCPCCDSDNYASLDADAIQAAADGETVEGIEGVIGALARHDSVM